MKIDDINSVVHLSMTAGSGQPQDASAAGNNFDGTLGGSATWSSDQSLSSEYSIAIPGTSGYVNLGNNSLLAPSTAFSISIWAYADSITGWHRMVSRYTTGGSPQYSYALMTNNGEGKVRFLVYPSSNTGAGVKMITDSVVLSTDQWHHIVATYSGADRRMRIYIDGSLVNSTLDPSADTTIPSSIRVSSANTALGSNYGGSSAAHQSWNGYLDEFSLWDVELTASQVAKIYRYGIRDGWNPLNDLENVRDFAHGVNSGGSAVSAYLTVSGGVSNIVITDDLMDSTELRTIEVSSGGVEAMSVAYIGDDLLAVSLDDSDVKIVSVTSGAESASIASTVSGTGLNGVDRVYKKRDVSNPAIIVATSDGKLRFVDTVSSDGTTNSGLSSKEFDISNTSGFAARIVDVELYNDKLAVIYRDSSDNIYFTGFNYDAETQITFTDLPFAPHTIDYKDDLWQISNTTSHATASNILDWE